MDIFHSPARVVSKPRDLIITVTHQILPRDSLSRFFFSLHMFFFSSLNRMKYFPVNIYKFEELAHACMKKEKKIPENV